MILEEDTENTGWTLGVNAEGKEGYFPSNYIKRVEEGSFGIDTIFSDFPTETPAPAPAPAPESLVSVSPKISSGDGAAPRAPQSPGNLNSRRYVTDALCSGK